MANSVTKMTLFAHGGISKKNLYGLCTYDVWKFKPKISSIFHFEYVNEVWISGVLGVNSKDAISKRILPHFKAEQAK